MDEHRILMGTVIEKIQSVKSGLTEACTSLLTGFEVCDVIMQKECHSIDVAPKTLSGVWKEKPDIGSNNFVGD